jgi:site-specific recombinase
VGNPAKKRFLFGVMLAWAPWIPTLIGLGYGLRGIFSTKATGLAAVAGGITESLVLWGIASMIFSQVSAIVLLTRSFSREHLSRNLVSTVSIVSSSVTLALLGGYLWMLTFLARR